MKRKITSILAADVVEFSRLVAEDEEDTLARLVSAQAVFGAHVSGHGGRIFNTAGDAILAEFPSAVEAVRAALAIQDGWRQVDNDAPQSRRLWFRMGIGIGDVVEHGTDLLGDGVNIAARLQGLAPPGGLAVSHWVQEQIAGKVNQPLIDIGEQDLKNIPKPVRVSIIDPAGLWVPPASRPELPSSVIRVQAAWAAYTAPAHPTTAQTLVGVVAALAIAVTAVVVLRPKRPQMIAVPSPIDGSPPALPTAAPPELADIPVVFPAAMPAPPVLLPSSRPAVPVPTGPEAPVVAPVIIDPPDFATPPPLVAKPAVVTTPQAPPETPEPKRIPIRPPQPDPKRLPSIEKKPPAK
jgi:class 3 adenylate cyclase